MKGSTGREYVSMLRHCTYYYCVVSIYYWGHQNLLRTPKRLLFLITCYRFKVHFCKLAGTSTHKYAYIYTYIVIYIICFFKADKYVLKLMMYIHINVPNPLVEKPLEWAFSRACISVSAWMFMWVNVTKLSAQSRYNLWLLYIPSLFSSPILIIVLGTFGTFPHF